MLHPFSTKPDLCRKWDDIGMVYLFIYLLILIYFYCWLPQDLTSWMVKVIAVSWSCIPQRSAMWLSVLTVLFWRVVPNIMGCIVRGSSIPSQTPPHVSLRRKAQTSPKFTQGRVIALLLCKLCNPNFWIFCLNTCSFCFVSVWMVSHHDPYFVIQLSVYEDFWSPRELAETFQ